jgi:3-phosphoshikimate 1-carboxyvinyltransferase
MRASEPASIRISRSGPIDATIRVPSSKSLTNRALAAGALARGRSRLLRPLAADDTILMAGAIRALGAPVAMTEGRWTIEGAAGPPRATEARLSLGNAGTAMRFLTPIVATGRGRFLLDGSERMRRRPIGDLIAALTALGVRARSIEGNGCPPVEVDANGLPGGEVTLRGSVSSQFLSGLLLAAPLAAGDLVIRIEGPLVSRPYVDLTLDVMKRFGAQVEEIERDAWRARAGGGYASCDYDVEGDASSACWWFAAAAVTGGRARVTGIPRASKQGDLRFLQILEEMGCGASWTTAASGPAPHGALAPETEEAIEVIGGPLRGVDVDLGDLPDAAPALGAVALFASGPTRIRGAAHLRDKESDRIAGLAAGLGRLGARTEEHRDGLTIHPGSRRPASLDPEDDHRLAMAFAVAGLGIGGVEILSPGCVTKSYPGFFEELASVVRAL